MKLLLILSLFTSFQLYCQSFEIKGTVMDENSGEALPYAHLYSPNNFGTIANDSGQFLISIDENALNDSMIVQSLGYEKKKISISALVSQPNSVLKLKKRSYLLNQVEITPKEADIVALGPDFNKKNCNSYIPLALYPFQIGIVIDIPYQARLDKVKYRISKYGSSKFKSLFRIRIYDYDTLTNKPSEELTRNSITTHLKSRRGWATVDVKSENIYVNNQKIFIAIETVKKGEVIRTNKVYTPEEQSRSSMASYYDMELTQCYEHYDKVKFQAYDKNYNNDTWMDYWLSPRDSVKGYPLIKIEVVK